MTPMVQEGGICSGQNCIDCSYVAQELKTEAEVA